MIIFQDRLWLPSLCLSTLSLSFPLLPLPLSNPSSLPYSRPLHLISFIFFFLSLRRILFVSLPFLSLSAHHLSSFSLHVFPSLPFSYPILFLLSMLSLSLHVPLFLTLVLPFSVSLPTSHSFSPSLPSLHSACWVTAELRSCLVGSL